MSNLAQTPHGAPVTLEADFMSVKERKQYQAILESKQAELAGSLANRDGIAIEKAADVMDEIQSAGERELAIRNLDRESNLLRKVRGALARMAGGTYGACLHCEAEINAKRLAAVPWAPYCIKCQEAADRHEFEVSDDSQGPLADAA